MKLTRAILRKSLQGWLPLALVIFTMTGTAYVLAQQVLHQSANDPQIQLSEDIAAEVSAGQTITSLISPAKVEASSSLAPFTMIFDNKGNVSVSNASVNNQTPQLPKGILEYAAEHGQDRFTWQPATNARIAAVVTPTSSGYVLVGRSLREVEKREDQALLLAIAGGLGSLFLTFAAILLLNVRQTKKTAK